MGKDREDRRGGGGGSRGGGGRGGGGRARYFVKVRLPAKRDVRRLADLDLDLHTVRGEAEDATAEGLMTLDDVRRVVGAGFPVLVESAADTRAHGRDVIEFDEWLAAQERDLGPLGER